MKPASKKDKLLHCLALFFFGIVYALLGILLTCVLTYPLYVLGALAFGLSIFHLFLFVLRIVRGNSLLLKKSARLLPYVLAIHLTLSFVGWIGITVYVELLGKPLPAYYYNHVRKKDADLMEVFPETLPKTATDVLFFNDFDLERAGYLLTCELSEEELEDFRESLSREATWCKSSFDFITEKSYTHSIPEYTALTYDWVYLLETDTGGEYYVAIGDTSHRILFYAATVTWVWSR